MLLDTIVHLLHKTISPRIGNITFLSNCCFSVAESCLMPGFPVLYYLPEFTQTHVHWVADAIQPSHPLSPPSSPPSIFPNIRVSSNESALRIRWPMFWSFGFTHQSFQWIVRVDFLQDWLVWSSCFPRDSWESPALEFENINSSVLSLFYGPALTFVHMATGKTIALTIWTLCQQNDVSAF